MLKRNQIISVLTIILLSTLFHGIYEKFPNFLTSIFFPVNESIWEHNKMILMSYLSWMLISFIIYRYDKRNVIFTTLITSIICIAIVNLVFTPIYLYILNTKDNIFITIGIFIIATIISQIIGYYLLTQPYNKTREIISLIILIVIITILAYLTYNPIELPIFYDYPKNIYGLPN